MAEGGFKLTANLIVKASQQSINDTIKTIKDQLKGAGGTISIGVDLTLVDQLHKKLAAIQQLAKAGVGNIGIKIRGATTKQIQNVEGLGKALKKYGPEIKAFKSKEISLKVTTPTKAAIEKIKDLAIWLKMANPIIKGFTNRNLVVGLRAPTTKAIANINAANVALKQIQPILAQMGGGANIGIKITGLGGKRLDGFAKGLGSVSAQLTKTIPDLHKLNTVLSQKITHLGQFQQAATRAGKSLVEMGKSSNSIKGQIDKTSSSVKNLANTTHEASNFMYQFGQSGGLALKRFGAFTIATSIVFGLVYAIKDAFTEAVDFEKQMAKIAQVTGSKTIRGVKGVSDEVSRLAIAYGSSSKELLGIAQIFAQAGLKGYELQKALDAVAKSDLAPTFTDMTNTGEGLISMIGQFNIKANEYERVLGSINQVSAEYAVESDDLVTAIRVFGGVFASASSKTKPGIKQLQELLATFTAIRSTTRESAESISTGMRTITTRIQRPRTIKFLEGYGINLEDTKGNFIGIWEAIDRISAKTKELGTETEAYRRISEEIGGYRQMGKVIPLLSEMEKRHKALQVAMRGEGSLDEQMDIQLQTLAKRATSVAESFKKMVRELTESSTFKLVADYVLKTAEAFIKLAEAIKPVLPMIVSLMAIKGFIAARQFGKGAIHELTKNKVIQAGINNVGTGGVIGYGASKYQQITNIPNTWKTFMQQAGFYQPAPTTLTRRERGAISNQYAGQLVGQIFPNAKQGTINHFTPRFQQILSPVIQQLARTYGVESQNFKVAMSAVNKELYRVRDVIKRNPGFYSGPGGAGLRNNLVGIGGRAANQYDRGKWGRGAMLIGGRLADSASLGMMGGMVISSIGESYDSDVLRVGGKTLTGAGIGAMTGSALLGPGPGTAIGAAAGTLVGLIKGITDALGSDAIARANREISKELSDLAGKMKDFNDVMLGFTTTEKMPEFMTNIADESSIAIRQLNKGIKEGQIEKDSEKLGSQSGGWWRNIGNYVLEPLRQAKAWGQTPMNAAYDNELPGQDPKIMTEYRDMVDEQISTIIKGLEPNTQKYGQLFKNLQTQYGGFFDENLNKTDAARKFIADSGITEKTFEELVRLVGLSNADRAKRTLEKVRLNKTDEGKNEALDTGGRIEARDIASKIEQTTKKLAEITFVFDKLKLSLEQLADVAERTSNANKALASTTDQYYSRALSGPSSNSPIFTPRENPFNTPGAFEPRDLLKEAKKLGFKGEFLKTIEAGATLKQQLPQLALKSQSIPAPEVEGFLEESLLDGSKGILAGVGDDLTRQTRAIIDQLASKEGVAFSYEDIIKAFDPIIQSMEDSSKIASQVFDEQVNARLQRIVDIVGKSLEIEEKTRQEELVLLQQRANFRKIKANLFYEEDPFAQGKRLDKEKNLTFQNIYGGYPQGGAAQRLLDERRSIESRISETDTTDVKAMQDLERVLFENGNELNKLAESLKLASDVNEQLANIQQQALQYQKRREAGRSLAGRLLNMSPTEIMELTRGGIAAAQLKLDPNAQVPRDNKELARGMDAFYSLVEQYGGTLNEDQRKAIEKERARFTGQIVSPMIEGTTPNGAYTTLLKEGATETGTLPGEEKLLTSFDILASNANTAAESLQKITQAQVGAAEAAFRREQDLSTKANKDFTLRANNIFILRQYDFKSDTNTGEGINPITGNGPLLSKAKGGKLSGTGPIPILAHGGELIIPKNKVDKGMSGVIEFAKRQGLVFENGGIVPKTPDLSAFYSKPNKEQLAYRINLLKRGYILEGTNDGNIKVSPTTKENLKNYSNNFSTSFKPTIMKYGEIGIRQRKDLSTKNIGEKIEYKDGKIIKYDTFGEETKDISAEMQSLKEKNLARRPVSTRYIDATKDRPEITRLPADITKQQELEAAALRQTEAAAGKYNTTQGLSDQRLAEMRVLGEYAWSVLNSGVPGNMNEEKAKELKSLLTSGSGDIENLTKRERRIQQILGFRPRDIEGVEVTDAGRTIKKLDNRFDNPLWKNAKRGYDRKADPSFSKESEEIRKRSIERNQKIDDKRIRPNFLTYRPEYYNKRYGEGYAQGFDPDKLQYNSVDQQKIDDLKRDKIEASRTRDRAIVATTGGVPSEELARMRVLGQFAWMALRSGMPGGVDEGKAERLRGLLTSGPGDIDNLRQREKQIRGILGLASGTPLVTKSGLAEIHKGEAIIPAKANPNNSSNSNNTAMNQFDNLDKTIMKLSSVLSSINIPEKITLEISQINHIVTFSGGDILTEQIASRVAERANQMIQKQIASVISPVNGEVLLG